MNDRDQPLRVEIVDGRLVISVGIDTEAFAFENSEYNNSWDDDANDYIQLYKIVDAQEFAKEIQTIMLSEREDGASPISLFLDETCRSWKNKPKTQDLFGFEPYRESKEPQDTLKTNMVKLVLSQLSPRQKEVMQLVYVREFSWGAAQKEMGLATRNQIYDLLKTSKRRAKEWWKIIERYVSPEEIMSGVEIAFISPTQAGQICGCTDDHIINEIKRGHIKAFRMGHMWKLRKEWVEEYKNTMKKNWRFSCPEP